ncbi:23560_t:CDS:10 [Cetraspora pellucida]|uniref:23560_t:CDS:1 n=1 Tax=Cetraspora pellucida TaxID=1433469 RepID=A0A9N8WH35_9GLOM|nr:23560_t:CDS:10 [Cetraspora pellucida]
MNEQDNIIESDVQDYYESRYNNQEEITQYPVARNSDLTNEQWQKVYAYTSPENTEVPSMNKGHIRIENPVINRYIGTSVELAKKGIIVQLGIANDSHIMIMNILSRNVKFNKGQHIGNIEKIQKNDEIFLMKLPDLKDQSKKEKERILILKNQCEKTEGPRTWKQISYILTEYVDVFIKKQKYATKVNTDEIPPIELNLKNGIRDSEIPILVGTAEFKWTDDCQKAMEELKQRVKNESLLSFPNMNKPFFMEIDASDHAIGAILYQQEDESQDHCKVKESLKKKDLLRNATEVIANKTRQYVNKTLDNYDAELRQTVNLHIYGIERVQNFAADFLTRGTTDELQQLEEDKSTKIDERSSHEVKRSITMSILIIMEIRTKEIIMPKVLIRDHENLKSSKQIEDDVEKIINELSIKAKISSEKQIKNILEDEMECIKFLQQEGILYKSQKCWQCENDMKQKDKKWNYMRCDCRISQSVLTFSFFNNHKIPINENQSKKPMNKSNDYSSMEITPDNQNNTKRRNSSNLGTTGRRNQYPTTINSKYQKYQTETWHKYNDPQKRMAEVLEKLQISFDPKQNFIPNRTTYESRTTTPEGTESVQCKIRSGTLGQHEYWDCPNAICNKCRETGHIHRNCPHASLLKNGGWYVNLAECKEYQCKYCLKRGHKRYQCKELSLNKANECNSCGCDSKEVTATRINHLINPNSLTSKSKKNHCCNYKLSFTRNNLIGIQKKNNRIRLEYEECAYEYVKYFRQNKPQKKQVMEWLEHKGKLIECYLCKKKENKREFANYENIFFCTWKEKYAYQIYLDIVNSCHNYTYEGRERHWLNTRWSAGNYITVNRLMIKRIYDYIAKGETNLQQLELLKEEKGEDEFSYPETPILYNEENNDVVEEIAYNQAVTESLNNLDKENTKKPETYDEWCKETSKVGCTLCKECLLPINIKEKNRSEEDLARGICRECYTKEKGKAKEAPPKDYFFNKLITTEQEIINEILYTYLL